MAKRPDKRLNHRVINADALSARLRQASERLNLPPGYVMSHLLERAIEFIERIPVREAHRVLLNGFDAHGFNRRADDHPEPSRSPATREPSRRDSPEPSRSRGDSGQASSADDDGSGVTLAQAQRALTELETVGSVRQQAAAIGCTHRALERLRAQVLRGGRAKSGELPTTTQANAWDALRAALARL